MPKSKHPYYYDQDTGKPIISRIKPEAFLVKDPSLSDMDAPFYKWLDNNHFQHAWHKGHYDSCPWVFINITHKLYAYGMPGVEIIKPIGNHAITIDEFMQIYNIYDKYKGLNALDFEEDKKRREQEEKESSQRHKPPEMDLKRYKELVWADVMRSTHRSWDYIIKHPDFSEAEQQIERDYHYHKQEYDKGELLDTVFECGCVAATSNCLCLCFDDFVPSAKNV